MKLSSNTPGDNYDVFISHAAEDANCAATVTYILRTNSYKVFFSADSEYPSPTPLDTQIIDAVHGCKYFVAVLSPNFVAKAWPIKELEIALNRFKQKDGITLIPLFYRLTYLDAAMQAEEFWKKYNNLSCKIKDPEYPLKATIIVNDVVELCQGIELPGDKNPDINWSAAVLQAINRSNTKLFRATSAKDFEYTNIASMIKNATSLKDLIELYEVYITEHASDLRSAISHNNLNQQDLMIWCKEWAQALNIQDESAKILDKKRKICLCWAYKLHDVLFDDKKDLQDLNQRMKEYKGALDLAVQNILSLCISMDRANSLYNMRSKGSVIPGMDWISTAQRAELAKSGKLLNPEDWGTMDRRLGVLVKLFALQAQEELLKPVFVKDLEEYNPPANIAISRQPILAPEQAEFATMKDRLAQLETQVAELRKLLVPSFDASRKRNREQEEESTRVPSPTSANKSLRLGT